MTTAAMHVIFVLHSLVSPIQADSTSVARLILLIFSSTVKPIVSVNDKNPQQY